MQGLDAGSVRRNQFRQIQLQWTGFTARDEQFRDLRFGETTGQTHDPSLLFLDDSDPAIHDQDTFARLAPKTSGSGERQ